MTRAVTAMEIRGERRHRRRVSPSLSDECTFVKADLTSILLSIDDDGDGDGNDDDDESDGHIAARGGSAPTDQERNNRESPVTRYHRGTRERDEKKTSFEGRKNIGRRSDTLATE